MAERPALTKLRAIWSHAARSGEPLPSEDAIARRIGASKPAVREALVRLEAEGLLRRSPGSGPFPNVAALDMPARLDQRADYAEMLRSAGFTPTTEVLTHRWLILRDELATVLDAPDGTVALETLKRWSADGAPVMLALDVIPSRSAPDPAIDPTESVLNLARCLGGNPAEWICSWPAAEILPAEQAALLSTDAGIAVLTLEHLGVGRHGMRCFYAREYHLPGIIRYGLILNVQS